MSDKGQEMWAAFEAHEPDASYAKAWRVMLKERTYDAVAVAYYAAPAGSAAEAAAWKAMSVVEADGYTQQAIDAIKEVKPPRIEGYNTNRDQPTVTIKEVKP